MRSVLPLPHAIAMPICWNFVTPADVMVYEKRRESDQIRSMLAGEHEMT